MRVIQHEGDLNLDIFSLIFAEAFTQVPYLTVSKSTMWFRAKIKKGLFCLIISASYIKVQNINVARNLMYIIFSIQEFKALQAPQGL